MKQRKKYISPNIKKIGDAKKIIKNVLVTSTGDTFPGTEDVLASS